MATTGNRSNKALKEAMTKTQLLNALSESMGLQKKDVALVLDELSECSSSVTSRDVRWERSRFRAC